LARCRNHFSQLLNVHAVNDVRHIEIHTAEPLVPEPSAFGIEMATEKLKGHKSPGMEHIPTELMKAGSRTIHCEIHNLIVFGIRSGRSQSLYLSIRREIKQTVLTIDTYHFAFYIQNFIHHPAVKVHSTCTGNYCGSPMWISTQQVNYGSYLLHSSSTCEEMGIQ